MLKSQAKSRRIRPYNKTRIINKPKHKRGKQHHSSHRQISQYPTEDDDTSTTSKYRLIPQLSSEFTTQHPKLEIDLHAELLLHKIQAFTQQQQVGINKHDPTSLIDLSSIQELKRVINILEITALRNKVQKYELTFEQLTTWIKRQMQIYPHSNAYNTILERLLISLRPQSILCGGIEDRPELVYILRNNFWRHPELDHPDYAPVEWITFLDAVKTNQSFDDVSALESINHLVRYLGIPFDLIDTSQPLQEEGDRAIINRTTSTTTIQEKATDMIESVLSRNDILKEFMDSEDINEKRYSYISQQWFQRLIQIPAHLLMFEDRLNNYHTNTALNPNHVPFALIFKRHFDSANRYCRIQHDSEYDDVPISDHPHQHFAYMHGKMLFDIADSVSLGDLYYATLLTSSSLRQMTRDLHEQYLQHQQQQHQQQQQYQHLEQSSDTSVEHNLTDAVSSHEVEDSEPSRHSEINTTKETESDVQNESTTHESVDDVQSETRSHSESSDEIDKTSQEDGQETEQLQSTNSESSEGDEREGSESNSDASSEQSVVEQLLDELSQQLDASDNDVGETESSDHISKSSEEHSSSSSSSSSEENTSSAHSSSSSSEEENTSSAQSSSEYSEQEINNSNIVIDNQHIIHGTYPKIMRHMLIPPEDVDAATATLINRFTVPPDKIFNFLNNDIIRGAIGLPNTDITTTTTTTYADLSTIPSRVNDYLNSELLGNANWLPLSPQSHENLEIVDAQLTQWHTSTLGVNGYHIEKDIRSITTKLKQQYDAIVDFD